MKKYFIIVATLLIVACTPKAETKHGYDAIMPPELKDCKVFTIFDGSKTLYVTRCGLDTSTSWTTNCGKNCTEHHHSSVIENERRYAD